MHNRKSKDPETLATYCRSYLLTLGLTFAVLALYASRGSWESFGSWPWPSYVFLVVFLLGGISLVLFGLLGPSSKMETWAEAASRHEASVIVMALAYPIYLVLAPFYGRR